MTAKDVLTVMISLLALLLSVLGLTTDTRGLSVIVRGGSLDLESRQYELHFSLVNTGTQNIMFFAPDVSAKADDADCLDTSVPPSLHAPRLDESITVEAGSIVSETLVFEFQSMRQGMWTICVDGLVADFVGESEEVRFKAGVFRISMDEEPLELITDAPETDPTILVDRALKVRSFPSF